MLLAAVPLVGLIELGLHAKQTSDVVSDADWSAARDLVKADLKPDDLVLFAPFWVDPVGREHFGDELTGFGREAAPDETRFPRAFEVSIRGAHRAELAGWKKVSEKAAGKVVVSVWENPAPVKVTLDLLSLLGTERMAVYRLEGSSESPCTWQTRSSVPSNRLGVPQGPEVPPDRYACSGGGYVGAGVLHALDHHPHLCLWTSGLTAARIKFAGVIFGQAIHGHSGVQWLVERTPSKESVSLAFSAFGRPLGTNIHRVGSGWTMFELPTEDIAGKRGELDVEVSGSNAIGPYCFEADIR